MSFSVIHFSDIHIKESSDTILKHLGKLKAACASALPHEGTVVLVISGDIAYSGKKSQYDLAKQLLDQIKVYIEEQKNSTVFFAFVPGNHDCNFENEESVRETLIDAVKIEKIDNSYYSAVVSVQKEYVEFARHYDLDAGSVLSQKVVQINGDSKVLFLLANTSWMSTIHEVPGKIIMPNNLFAKTNSQEYKAVFYVYHHPDNWLNPDCKNGFIDHVRSNADIILVGHEHTKDSYQKTGCSFSVFCNHGKELQNSNGSESAFSVFNFDSSFQNYTLIDYFWDKDKYIRKSEEHHQYHKNISSALSVFHPNPDSIKKANDIGITISHFSKEDIVLTDLFVCPDLNMINHRDEKTKAVVIRSRAMDKLLNTKINVLVGASSSGKTSLAKMMFINEANTEKCCLLLDGSIFSSIDEAKISSAIENVFCEQYAPELMEEFRQLPKEKRSAIIDNFDFIRHRNREKVLDYLCGYFENVTVFLSSSIDLTSLFTLSPLRDQEKWLYYDILPLGNKKRHELISRWYNLGADNLDEEEINSRIENSRKQIDTFLGNGAAFIPAMPIIIISALQNSDAAQPNLSMSKYGFLYESLILRSLSRISADYTTSGAFNIDSTILSQLAYDMLSNKKTRFSESELILIVKRFSEEFLLPVSASEILQRMSLAKIICKDETKGELYKFKYPYIFYYFSGRYIAYHLKEKAVQDKLEYMSSKLFIETYGNVIVFVCHFANSKEVIEDVLLNAYSTLDNYDEFDFINSSPVFESIQEVIDKLIPKSVGNNEMVPDNRNKALVEMDRAGINDGQANSGEDIIVDDISEDDVSEREKDLIAITSAFKTITVLGEILQNYPGEINGPDKVEIINEIHKLGMRSVQAIIDSMGYLEQELIELVLEQSAKRKAKYHREDVLLATKKFFGMLISSMAQSMVHQVANSINSPYLLAAAEKTFFEDTSISAKLVLLDLKLNCLKKANYVEIKQLKKSFDSSGEKFASRILDSIVGYYLNYNQCDHALRSKLCSLCGFSEQKTMKKSQQKKLTQ